MMKTLQELDFDPLEFNDYTQNDFNEMFTKLPRYIFETIKRTVTNDEDILGFEGFENLFESFEHCMQVVTSAIKQNNNGNMLRIFESISKDMPCCFHNQLIIAVGIENKDIDCYDKFIKCIDEYQEFANLYYNSDYVKQDLLNVADTRLKEILAGIEIPENIIIEKSYNQEDNNPYHDVNFKAQVHICLYDKITNIRTNNDLFIDLNHISDYGSLEHVFCKSKNEQHIRHGVKQFIKDMANN